MDNTSQQPPKQRHAITEIDFECPCGKDLFFTGIPGPNRTVTEDWIIVTCPRCHREHKRPKGKYLIP